MWGKIGSILTIGCLIHCIVFPIIVPILPLLGIAAAENTTFHAVIYCAILLTNTFSLMMGVSKHGNIWPFYVGLWGLILLSTTMLLPYWANTYIDDHFLALKVTTVGSILLLLANYFNHKSSCKCKHHDAIN